MEHRIAVAVPFTATGPIVQGTTFYYDGISCRETAGAVAAVRVHQGTSAAGPIVAAGSLPANGTWGECLDLAPVRCDGGIFVEIVTGAVEGAVRYL